MSDLLVCDNCGDVLSKSEESNQCPVCGFYYCNNCVDACKECGELICCNGAMFSGDICKSCESKLYLDVVEEHLNR